MSTSSVVRAAWKTAIFDSATIQAITDKCHDYDILANIASMPEDSRMYYGGKINFFTYLTTRKAENGSLRGTNTIASRFSFRVKTSYYIEKDISESDQNYNSAIDNLELLDNLVRSALGKTWSSTVDYWEIEELKEPSLLQLDDREVWQIGYNYLGFKTV